MDTSIQLFNFQEQPVRVILVDGEPWWIAADVCKILGIVNVSKSVQELDEDEKGITESYTPGGKQKVTIISEPGLYRLIMRSNKPAAKTFTRWVTHDVLPTIRRTGKYSVEEHGLPVYFNKQTQERCILNEKLIPEGFWAVETEMVCQASVLQVLQKELKHWALPSGSGGKRWINHLRAINHPLLDEDRKVKLWVPNLKQPVDVFIYPIELLSYFRKWLRTEYAQYYDSTYLPSRLKCNENETIDTPKTKRLKKAK